jgi:pimeloyl-ACP methyl ester carboxylesterase
MTTEAAAGSSVEKGEFVNVRGFQTHIHTAGTGAPIVLIHGSGPGVTAWANWRSTLPFLASKGFHVYAYDILGFGYTERKPGERYHYRDWVDQLIAVIEDVVGEPAMLLGNSLGGALSLRVASERPDLVRRMALMGSGGLEFKMSPSLEAIWGYTPSIENMHAMIAEHFAYDPALATRDLVRMRYEASMQPGFQESYAALFPAPREPWIAKLSTPEDDIRKITAPTLLFHGREDKVVPLSVSYRLLELIADAQLHVFGKCGHWTQVERAAEFNALAALFFEGGR